MNEINTDPVLDMKTLFAIYTDPDGVSIIVPSSAHGTA